jgi:hypothetical protein
MVNNKNIILTFIGAIGAIVATLLANTLSPVFSPLSDLIKDDITSKPIIRLITS